MSSRSRWSAPGSLLLLAAALAAAAPIARWCPISWEAVDPAAYVACAAGFTPRTTLAGEPCASVADCVPTPVCPVAPACGNTCDAPESGESSPPGSRAYCLDDPGMGTAVREHSPELTSPLVAAAVMEVLASLAPAPRVTARVLPADDERPPSAPPSSRPPVRGPPSLLA